jgi:quaternary ammonium compound-resistance protein SugE
LSGDDRARRKNKDGRHVGLDFYDLLIEAFTAGGVFMKHADGLRNLMPSALFLTLFALGASLQSQALRRAELGVTYILILGIEAMLAFGFGVLFFSETVTLAKAGAILLILAGAVLLRVL